MKTYEVVVQLTKYIVNAENRGEVINIMMELSSFLLIENNLYKKTSLGENLEVTITELDMAKRGVMAIISPFSLYFR